MLTACAHHPGPPLTVCIQGVPTLLPAYSKCSLAYRHSGNSLCVWTTTKENYNQDTHWQQSAAQQQTAKYNTLLMPQGFVSQSYNGSSKGSVCRGSALTLYSLQWECDTSLSQAVKRTAPYLQAVVKPSALASQPLTLLFQEACGCSSWQRLLSVLDVSGGMNSTPLKSGQPSRCPLSTAGCKKISAHLSTEMVSVCDDQF